MELHDAWKLYYIKKLKVILMMTIFKHSNYTVRKNVELSKTYIHHLMQGFISNGLFLEVKSSDALANLSCYAGRAYFPIKHRDGSHTLKLRIQLIYKFCFLIDC